MESLTQLRYLRADLECLVSGGPWRWFSAPFSGAFIAVMVYRLDRAAYLALGDAWRGIRFLLSPVGLLLRPWLGRCEIHYRAEIGPGVRILHPSLGVVIAGGVVIGEGLILTGGNCIGFRGRELPGQLVIGSQVDLGANASVIGPLTIGDRVRVGANGVVVSDLPSDTMAGGVPARVITAGGR